MESRQDATLVITFKTGAAGERLNRVRFWLRDEKGLPKLYPRSKGYISDPEGLSKKVVIDHLPAGHYSLQFIYPNRDQFFENLALREFDLRPDTVMKIDQVIRPKYASITAFSTGADEDKASIKLLNDKNEVVISSSEGRLEATQLMPGTYQIRFGKLAGYKTPTAITISIKAGEQVNNLHGEYQRLPRLKSKEAIAFNEEPIPGALLLDGITLPTFSARYSHVNSSEASSSSSLKGASINAPHLFPKVPIAAPLFSIGNSCLLQKPKASAQPFNGLSIMKPCSKPRVEIDKVPIQKEPCTIENATNESCLDEEALSKEEPSYIVTNGAFARWLNQLCSEGSLLYDEEGPQAGLLLSCDGSFLGRTAAAASGSQIIASRDDRHFWRFAAAEGKEGCAVKEVSWYAIERFYKENEAYRPEN